MNEIEELEAKIQELTKELSIAKKRAKHPSITPKQVKEQYHWVTTGMNYEYFCKPLSKMILRYCFPQIKKSSSSGITRYYLMKPEDLDEAGYKKYCDLFMLVCEQFERYRSRYEWERVQS